MKDEDAKYLTERMGECWHEIFWGVCPKCGLCRSNRTFTTWADFGAVWEWAKEQDWWPLFIQWFRFFYCRTVDLPIDVGFPQATNMVDREQFPALVVAFLREQEARP